MGSLGERYEIRIDGIIGPEWSDWFDDMAIRSEASGETILVGRVRDQAELRGLLARLGDLNLTLISVNRVDERQDDPGLPHEKESER